MILRRPEQSDAASIVANANHKSVAKYVFIPSPYRLKDAREFIAMAAEHEKVLHAFHRGIVDPATNRMVGMIGHYVEPAHNRAMIGYWLGPDYWGRGYCSEALNLMLRAGFRTQRLRRIAAMVDPDNGASIRVLERNGLVCEGLLRSQLKHRGRYLDVFLYAALSTEWKG